MDGSYPHSGGGHALEHFRKRFLDRGDVENQPGVASLLHFLEDAGADRHGRGDHGKLKLPGSRLPIRNVRQPAGRVPSGRPR